MRYARTAALSAVLMIPLYFGAAAPRVLAAVTGGTLAPSAPLAGGAQYGVLLEQTEAAHPAVGELDVPSTATAGRPPRVTLEIDEPGVRTVQAQVAVFDLSTRKAVIVASMGWIPTGRALTARWPRGASLKPGSYHVSVSAHDRNGQSLLRRAHSSGVVTMLVKAPPPAPTPTPTPTAGAPTPAQTAATGAVFPVAAPHNFGGPENRFGAPRAGGAAHQGQDVLTAEGSPVVFPLAGTILTASYQAGGAGYYAVEHTGVGLDFMFAHCRAGSLAVSARETVVAGQALCQAGQTGDATAPHLHFEVWVGGWRTAQGRPIDPLPYLQAWDHG